MSFLRRSALEPVIRRYRITLLEVALFLAFMTFAALIAFEIDVFPNSPGVPPQEHIIELDEAFALVAMLCIGLLVLSWRFLLSQRREVTRRIEAERQARELALRDALTGLPNRRRFDQDLKAAIAAPPRTGAAHAIFLLDLNDFKGVNDIYGHGVGDEVLVNVSMRLARATREGDLVARFGGDEFAILAQQLVGPEDATSIALRVMKELDEPIVVGSVQHRIGVGIGITLVPQDGQDATEVLRKADIALYRAKAETGSAFRFFEAEMDRRIRERDLIERELRDAIRNHRIEPYYQPIIDLRSKQVIGFEVLARWRHPTLGDVPPERFIPIAESIGLMSEMADYLLRQAVMAAAQWPNSVTLSFNISPLQLKDHSLALRILSILAEARFSPHRLEIELTEAALVRDLEGAQEILGSLREAGVRIALDDFGTGYSSLYHLRNFKLDKIKIDRSFVANMETEPEAAALVRALLGLCLGLGLTVTAEGVEQTAQATALLGEGCQQAQGFLYSEAVSAAGALRILSTYEGKPSDSLVRVA
jgi:diguanylate cyclase (GGDEF)-like protein